MTIPNETSEHREAPLRQIQDVAVMLARVDERLLRFIESYHVERKERDKDLQETRRTLDDLVTRVGNLETSHKADRQSLALLQKVGAGLLTLLSAAGGAVAWYFNK